MDFYEKTLCMRIVSSQFLFGLILFSVAIFAIHNAEEIMGMDSWAHINLPAEYAELYETNSFRIAALLLLFLYAVIAGSLWLRDLPFLRSTFLIGANAILTNGIVHAVISLLLNQPMPGICSAILLIIPLFSAIIWLTYQLNWTTPVTLLGYFMAGAVAQFLLASGALVLSRYLLRM